MFSLLNCPALSGRNHLFLNVFSLQSFSCCCCRRSNAISKSSKLVAAEMHKNVEKHLKLIMTFKNCWRHVFMSSWFMSFTLFTRKISFFYIARCPSRDFLCSNIFSMLADFLQVVLHIKRPVKLDTFNELANINGSHFKSQFTCS